MLVPVVVGYLCARYERSRKNSLALALGLGLVIGIMSGLHMFPLSYPFYALVTHTTSTSMGQFMNIEAYFLWEGCRLWGGGVIDYIWLSPLILFFFIPICLVGSYLGLVYGWHRIDKGPSKVWEATKNS
ncbi:MAG: hypothetical protein ACE5IO_03785 [Thermoplasmata archaeon]